MNALRLVREVDKDINEGYLSMEEGVDILEPLFNVLTVEQIQNWFTNVDYKKYKQYLKDPYDISYFVQTIVEDMIRDCGAEVIKL